MSNYNETDGELEERARAQAEAILTAQAAAFAEPPPVAALLSRMGLSKPAPAVARDVPQPGRELMLWRMRTETDVRRALELGFRLFAHPGFLATVPPERDCPIATYQARRKWNDAALEWTKKKDPKAQGWLKADRRLLLRKQGPLVVMVIERKDLDVRFDPKEQKLVPVRVERMEPVTMETLALVLDRFPALTAKQVVDGLRCPTRSFVQAPARSRSAADAYVANAPLFVTNMEVYMQDKKKPKEEKEDPNKGFVTWLSNTLRSANSK